MQRIGNVYEFEPFRLEVDERRLLRNGQPVPLRAKLFDTLLTLVANHGSLVTKDTLMGAVWPDTAVKMKPLGDGFIKLIGMMIAPIVFCIIVSGISGMGSAGRVARCLEKNSHVP